MYKYLITKYLLYNQQEKLLIKGKKKEIIKEINNKQ